MNVEKIIEVNMKFRGWHKRAKAWVIPERYLIDLNGKVYFMKRTNKYSVKLEDVTEDVEIYYGFE